MNVIVTGASGFIGSAVMKRFKAAEADVTGWDINPDPDENIIGIDMCDPQSIDGALDGTCPDMIIHCAGSANVGNSIANPDKDMLLSVGITHNLLFGLVRAGIKNARIIYLSSAGVYGNPVGLPVSESAKLSPVSPYGLHKMMCEDICSYFANNHGLDVRIARIFSAYGTGLRKQIFWDMFRKYSDTGRLDMFGTGGESRDFINIEDLKEAIYLMAVKDYDHRVINIANGMEITIKEVVHLFAEEMGIPDSGISFNGQSRPGDPNNWCADITRLEELGYVQSIDIKTGIGQYCKWLMDDSAP